VPLFAEKLSMEDFGRITKKLQEEKVPFTTRGDTIILLKDNAVKNKTIMSLSQEGLMPKGRYTFLDIINSKKLTTNSITQKIQLRQALEGKLEELLEASELVDGADVTITMPEPTVFVKERSPVKVAVMLTPKYGVNLLEEKKAIKGIEQLAVNSIDRAELENIVITDNYGVKLNDWIGEESITRIATTKEEFKMKEDQLNRYQEKLSSAITQLLPPDRFSLLVDVSMNFDDLKETRTEILPVVLRADDPSTPYDDGERKYSVTISKKITDENFKGPNWIPEGPPGFDSNVPPGYKGALEQMTEYIKKEEITNEVTGESKKEIKKDPWEIQKITASVAVDGTWEIIYDAKKKPEMNPDGSRKRKYIPVSPETIKNIKGFVEQGIGFSIERGDKVEVYEMQKDRSGQFLKEDLEWQRKKQFTMALFAGLIALIILIILTIAYRLIAKELERRKRLREEELARQHQLAREMALKSAEEEGLDVEMSPEDKERLELQEHAINIAREHPEEVAQLIRTWLTEE
jgi:flagellar M-ring protein FliF